MNHAVPELKRKLKVARTRWVAEFFNRAAGVAGFHEGQAHKADSPLNQEQADELKQAVSNMEGGGYSAVLYDDLSAMVVSGYTSARELLDLSIDFSNGVPSYAMEALRKHSDEFAFLVNQREQDYLNDLIDQALAAGRTPGELAENIARGFEDGYHITDDQGNVIRTLPSDSWSEMVARTELSRAQSLGNDALYRDVGIEKVLFATTQGANVCDECEPYDGQIFAIDDAPQPPLHPCCCCVLIAADEDVNPEAA